MICKDFKDFIWKYMNYEFISFTTTLFEKLNKDKFSELILLIAENFGRLIYKDSVGEEKIITPLEWVKVLSEKVFNPQGIGLVFSEISDEKVVIYIFKCPTPERAGKEPYIACPFSYGYARGLWKCAFPNGEVILNGTMAHGAPTCQFTLIVNASAELQKEEYKKAKKYLTREEEFPML